MSSFWIGYCVTGLITFLIVVVIHYFPWSHLLGKALPVIVRYILGTLSIVLPISALVLTRTNWTGTDLLIAIWWDVFSAGLGVIAFAALDYVMDVRSRMQVAESETKVLKQR